MTQPNARLRPTIELRSKDRRNPKSCWLQEHKRNVKTTHGEDGIFLKIFEVLGGAQSKFLVDFGAGDGLNLSNSFNLLTEEGWKGLLIEPGQQFDALKKLYEKREDVICVEDIVGYDADNSLDAHLARVPYEVPKNFDLLSIDIDGNDLYVWKDLKNYKPRVVCIEFNHSIPLDVYLLQPRDMSLNIGSSLLATVEVARELGYELVSVCGPNAIFVTAEDYSKFNIEDNDVEAMAYIKNEAKLIYSYDGTLYIAGAERHPWKGFRVDEERIQPLPSNMREWKFEHRRIWPTKYLTG